MERHEGFEPNTEPEKVSRRWFLQTGAAAAAGATAGYLGRKYLREKYEDAFDVESVTQEVEERLTFLKDVYGLDLQFSLAGIAAYKATGEVLTVSEQRDVLKWILPEVSKYPPQYIKDLQLDTWFIVKNFVDNGNASVGGDATPVAITRSQSGQESVVESRTQVRLNIMSGTISFHHPIVGVLGGGPRFLEDFHHEFGHAADNRYNTPKYTEEYGQLDYQSWEKLNSQGADAYIGDEAKKLPSSIYDSPRPEGFVCGYGQKSVHEDQATVCQLLFTDIARANFLIEQDHILAKKVTIMKQGLQQRSSGKIYDQYWKDLEAGKVNFSYWGIKEGRGFDEE